MFFSLFYRIIFINLILLFAFILTAFMPQHSRKATAKLVIFKKSAKEKTKKHQLFLSFL